MRLIKIIYIKYIYIMNIKMTNESDYDMTEELRYINRSPAYEHIMFYLRQGFSADKAILRGMEEYAEELHDTICHQERYIEHLEDQTYYHTTNHLDTDSDD